MINQNQLKQAVAVAALAEIKSDTLIGVGTGSTVNYFIEALAAHPVKIKGAVASSKETEKRLKACGIPVVDVHEGPLAIYIDGADECNDLGQLIKGGGGALTGEKILAGLAPYFVCMIDESKRVKQLGTFPLPIEVISMARSFVAREIVKLGGDPVYRQGFVSDHGNPLLDIYHLNIVHPIELEQTLNQIPGVVCNGLFAQRGADKVLIATPSGIETLISP